ncbi:hypothetical protein [Candidatus Marithrix sp. Canyon 246]|jgi:hypothetical protein|uniref:hypothetical protein n=1 Tax=Candidatus Marithrix sp. Canyon 246 TaxID=1827136 RepID=UPI00084A0714|nr:hypothetical protein [Candidatus Marithrix sp. Canyon 246]
MSKSIFKKDKRYSFSDYFYMSNPTEEILAELGYSLNFEEIQFPLSQNVETTSVDKLKNVYYRLLPKITLNSEIAKREFMIAPLLHQVMLDIDAKLNIEYPIDIDDKLNGFLDYLIRSKQELIVIEAKKGDLERGFNQLAAEMIALDKYEENDVPEILYGAITIGEVWRFALLKRTSKTLVKDINLFRFPQDTKDILAILMGILSTA